MESNEDVSIPQPGMAIKADDDDLHLTSRDPCKIDKIATPEETKAHHRPVLQEHFLNKDNNNKVSGGHEVGEAQVINVPRFLLDGRSIIIFSDVCQAVLKTWGSYNNLQNMLKNLGIEKCQFDQSQVMLMLKNIGVVDLQTKRCSFITEEDFIQIVHKYDEEYSTNYAKYFQLTPAIAIDDHSLAMKFQRNQGEEEHYQVSLPGTTGLTQSTMPLQFNIHVFSIGNQDCVNLSEVYGLFKTHFQRPDFLNQVLQNLKIAVGTFTAYEQARVKIQSSISCDDNLRKLYITKKDFERVLQYTSALFDTNSLDISWVQLGNLGVTVDRAGVNRYGNVLSNPSSTYVMAKIPENSIATDKDASQENIVLGSESHHAMPHPCTKSTMPESENSSASETAGTSNSGMRCVIRTCLVNGEVVVCIPDLHKAVIDLYGQSVQVGNYMHRLNIPTHRFSRNFLKRLKAHNILSSKATICTYITKADAERLLKMYNRGIHSDNRTDSLPRIEWGEPIILENAVNASHYHLGQIDSLFIQQNDEVKVKIPLFIINRQVVVAMPDVHRAVQLLNGHSVQLRYDLDKLGITKHKYSYSEVHQLRVQGHLDRPSLCTYVTKADVDRLLQYYTTPENEDRLKFIEWQQPVAVESIQNASACDSMGSSEIESIGAEDENNTDGLIANDYSISDLYKAFVGDDLESGWSSSNEIDDNHSQKTLQQISPLSSPTLPTLTFSPVLQRTLDKRDELISGSDLLQANTTASSHIKSTSQQPSDRIAVNQAVMKVSQMQVDLCSRSECNPAVSKALCISPQTFCERHNPIVTTAVSNQTSSQVLPPSTSSSCTTVPDFNICRADTSSTNAHVSPLATGATVRSVSAATTGRVGQFLSYGSTSCAEICLHSPKRSNVSSLSGPTWLEKQAKKHKADDEDILKTLQRKETEMRILHDAYQEQIKQEREHRLALQRELDQLKDSNTDLLKNIERKELEMKILHDSYKLQMDLERKKREELEMEVLQLRGKLGASANVPRVKQELL